MIQHKFKNQQLKETMLHLEGGRVGFWMLATFKTDVSVFIKNMWWQKVIYGMLHLYKEIIIVSE